MASHYTEHYLRALNLQDERLLGTFDAERDFLWEQTKDAKRANDSPYNVLEVGCGTGRALQNLASKSAKEGESLAKFVQRRIDFIGIDNDERLIAQAQGEARHIVSICRKNVCSSSKESNWRYLFTHAGIEFKVQDARTIAFTDNTFDVTFATYNLLGCVFPEERRQILKEMVRVTKPNGRIVAAVWNKKPETTKFLREYYGAIGFTNVRVNKSHTFVKSAEGFPYVFFRLSPEQLKEAYKNAGVKNGYLQQVGPLWTGIVGIKSAERKS
jgi:ubiquinone/menaquinone biosynthesis C-methylase UbiE